MIWVFAILLGASFASIFKDPTKFDHTQVAREFGPHRFDGFADFMDRFAASDKSLCSANSQELRKAAVQVMDDTLLYLKLHISGSSKFSSEEQFQQIMMEKWDALFGHLALTHKRLNPKSLERIDTKEALEGVKKSLSKGVIPLPTTTEETKTGKSLFGYSALRNYFFLGVVPVSVVSRDSLELTSLISHPLRPSLVKNLVKFAQHDIEHGSFIISHNRKSINCGIQANCEAFKKCLHALEKTRGIPKHALYYLLHEDRHLGANLILQDGLSGGHLADFAFEKLFSKPQFDLYTSLLGKSAEEKGKACSSARQFVLGYEVENVFEKLMLQDTLDLLTQKTKFTFVFRFPRSLTLLFKKLNARCSALIEHEGLVLIEDPNHSVLRTGVEDLIQKGFPQALHNYILKMLGSFTTISAAMRKLPCSHLSNKIDAL